MSRSGLSAIAAGQVFDGGSLHADAAVLIDGSRIVAVMPRAELPAGVEVRDLPEGAWLAPGFIDLQVNGGADILFNDDPTAQAISKIRSNVSLSNS